MKTDLKLLFASLGFALLLLIGFVIWQSNSLGKEEADDISSEAKGVEILPTTYNLGKVPIGGGIVTKEYEIKNTSGKALKLKRITTSCMCTQAKVIAGEKETRFFGMEHSGDRNPLLNFEIASHEKGKVVVNFDPAAHGPSGVGPFERVVSLAFSDPLGIKELTFNGEVVSK